MKLNTKTTEIERNGVKGETEFTIKTNALSFSILSSGLYTDPITAIIRELSCNAYDSHVAANKTDVPFEIHLPNSLEPFFSIKDYGVGLSDEEIRGVLVPVMIEDKNGNKIQATNTNGAPKFTRVGALYTTYFDSTKNDSNDYIGALGLGSKSPFSYTDAFEVISRHNGKKRTYGIFLNETGVPTVALMSEINTDEPNGLEVKLSVKKEDFSAFKNKTASVLRFFPVKPKIHGYPNFKFEELPKIHVKTNKWIVTESKSWESGNFIAVQGNVPYRVEISQIQEHIKNPYTSSFFYNTKIIVFFDIGKLDISANREEIRYNKQTIEVIVKRLEDIRKEFTEEINKKVERFTNKNVWNAFAELNKFSIALAGGSLLSLLDEKYVKNNLLKEYLKTNGTLAIKNLRGYCITEYNLKKYSDDYRLIRAGNLPEGYIKPSHNIVVAINDGKRDALKQIKQYMVENGFFSALILTKREPGDLLNEEGNDIPYEGHDIEWKKIIDMLGNVNVVKASELNYVLKSTKTKNTNLNKTNVFKYSGVYYNSYYIKEKAKFIWDECDLDLNAGGIYIPIKYGSRICFIYDKNKFSPIDIHDKLAFNSCLKIAVDVFNDEYNKNLTIKDIYGIPSKEYKNIKGNKNWINILKYIKKALKKYKDDVEFIYRLKNSHCSNNIKAVIDDEKFILHLNNLDDNSTFKNILMPVVEKRKRIDKNIVSIAKDLANIYEIFFDCNIKRDPFWTDESFSKYPMLTFMGNLYYNKQEFPKMFEYIKLVDRS